MSLKKYMKPKHAEAMKNIPTYHSNCIQLTGVARPGKTARDKAKRA